MRGNNLVIQFVIFKFQKIPFYLKIFKIHFSHSISANTHVHQNEISSSSYSMAEHPLSFLFIELFWFLAQKQHETTFSYSPQLEKHIGINYFLKNPMVFSFLFFSHWPAPKFRPRLTRWYGKLSCRHLHKVFRLHVHWGEVWEKSPLKLLSKLRILLFPYSFG